MKTPVPTTRGFNIVELLLVIAILSLVVGVSVQSYVNFSRAQSLAASASALAGALRDARARTLASVSASQYGVKTDTNIFTVFKGSSFSSSTPGNETFTFPYPVAASSSSSMRTVTFTRVTGNASASGTIDLYLPGLPGVQKKTVSIQNTGLVSIQ
ncbi:MAG TPA: prepilin-type N-terminal cleavage/methylation domain-containing protein [Candidatus Paceibacterota bacterium]|nr:prepilin-type N-terminal cleavage/methylation domain-containing protein [Candidatus Paceibacterota bacterium]